MSGINSSARISPIDLYSSFTELPGGMLLGQLEYGNQGKAFRLCKVGDTALVVGNVIQGPTTDTQFQDLVVPTARAAGVSMITLTNGTTAITANQFDGGSVAISTSSTASANIGEEYTILGHSTAISGAAITLYLDRPLRTALTTATTTGVIVRSPYSGVIVGATAMTGALVGVAIYPIPAAAYGWVQSKGVCAALSDNSTFAKGSGLSNSAATGGAVGVAVTGTTRAFVGNALEAQNSTHAIHVDLKVD
jgi:hypothetical protein